MLGLISIRLLSKETLSACLSYSQVQRPNPIIIVTIIIIMFTSFASRSANSAEQSSPSVVMQVPGAGSATSAGLVNGFETIYNRQAWVNHSPLATTFASMFVILPSTFVGKIPS